MSQQIYKATYSGVPVYEISCNGIAVMRRKNDSYMNATQILKVADFDKPQRTRILEREVQTDEHEKIQGGYGKYQGTWVPLENATRLARNYSVDDLIRPLLDFVQGDESPPLAPKHVTAASTKPRKPRERRARKKTKHLDDDGSDINDDSGLSAKEEGLPYAQTPSPRRQHRRAATAIATAANDPAESDGSAYSENGDDHQSKTTRHSRHKRTKLNSQLDYMEIDDPDEMDLKLVEKTSVEKTSPFISKAKQRQQLNKPSHSNKPAQSSSSSPLSSPNLSSSASTPPPLPSSITAPPSSADRMPTVKYKQKKEVEHERTHAHKLLAHFLSENEDIPALLQYPPRDLDMNIIIDEEGHTCLHWAAVMGHLATVHQLVQLKADLNRVNYKGQTALMRSVLYTNNYDQKTFNHLLNLLSSTTFNIDKNDQTVFHHVAATATGKGKLHATRYYMENLINKLAHNRSELISILNVQDIWGDTVLTIASRNGNRRLVRLLIDAGASTEIANEEGKTAQGYLELLDQHSATDKGGMDGDIPIPETMASFHYQSEEMIREQLRQKVDTIYKSMLAGDATTTTPTLSRWVDGLAASYDRDLTHKELSIKEKQRDTKIVINRLDETKISLGLLTGDKAQQVKEILDHGDRLSKELRQVLLYTQEMRLGKWVREKEDMTAVGDMKDSLSGSSTTTPMPLNTENRTNAPGLGPLSSTHSTSGHKDSSSDTQIEKGDNKTTLETQFSRLQQTRRELMNDLMTHRTKICDKRIQNYKRLISMCCNIAYENVDSMLTPILMSFDESDAVKSTKETIAAKSS